MPSADRLLEFAAIVEAGSVSEAARTLELPRSGLSRRLASLESELGTRLMHRQTRRLALTPAGEELYTRARRIVAETNAAWAAVRQCDDTPRGLLRISVADARMAAAELFVEFARDFSEVRLEVSVTPRHVDLVAEGIDVALRFGQVKSDSLVARRLWSTRSMLVASPEYLARNGHPDTPKALKEHDCIVGFGGTQTATRSWPLIAGGSVPVSARFATSALKLQIAAAEQGLGIALVPHGTVAEHLRARRLEPVLPNIVGSETPLNLVFVDRELMPPPMRLFIERATAYYAAWGAEG